MRLLRSHRIRDFLDRLEQAEEKNGKWIAMQKVIDSVRWVYQKREHISYDSLKAEQFSRRILTAEIPTPPWDFHHHFNNGSRETVAYILLLDTLNFCFWPLPGQPRWEITYAEKRISGYIALAATLKSAVLAGASVLETDFMATMTETQLKAILGGGGELQLMPERAANVRQLGQVLAERYHGDGCLLVESANQSAVALAQIMARHFSSFNDVAVYQQQTVYFYKRAQILAADLHGAFAGKQWGAFKDMDRLTAFADYKLPQVLRHLGILIYDPHLDRLVEERRLIPPGSPEEVEIRAMTIFAVNQIRGLLRQMGKNITAGELDWILWNLGQEDRYRIRPYHLTRTIFY